MNAEDYSQSIRSEVVNTISSILPFDSLEKEQLDFVKKWIASGAEIFRIVKPDKPNIHLVSYFIVVDQTSNEMLLVDHKKAGFWLPAGGHVEVNEHPKDTVRREIKEELGIEADFLFEDPVFLTVTNTVGNVASHIDVSLWYVLKGSKKNALKYDVDEFYQIRWFTLDDMPFERSDPLLKRFVDKSVKKIFTLNTYDVSCCEYAKNIKFFPSKDEV